MPENGKNTGPPGQQVMTDDQARAILVAMAASVGRFQAPELWIVIQQALGVGVGAPNVFVNRPMPLNRPAESIGILGRFRVTVANNNMVSVAPEAPQNLLQLVQLNGTSRRHGALQPIRMQGSTIYSWMSEFQPAGAVTEINGVTAVDPGGAPFVSPFTGTIGTHDMIVWWTIPLTPQMGIGQSCKRDWSQFLYQPDDWGDTLQLQLQFGDVTALGVPVAAADVTFSAFGSGAGNPEFSVFVNYSILGAFANSLDHGVCIRQERFYPQFVTAGGNVRIDQLQKQITSSLIVKTGLEQAAPTGGVQTFATLVDNQLDRTQITVDNKPVKFNQSNRAMKSYLDRMYAKRSPAGYFMLSFVEGQNPSLAYRADGLAGGASFELQSDILTTDSAQRLAFTQEMIYGGPFPANR